MVINGDMETKKQILVNIKNKLYIWIKFNMPYNKVIYYIITPEYPRKLS